MKILFLFVLLGCSLAAAARAADVLVTDKGEHEGMFLGFEDGTFRFRSKGGQTFEEPQAGVSSLSLAKPCSAVLVRSSKSKPENVEILRYAKPKFYFRLDGKDSNLFGSRIRSITVEVPAAARGAGGAGGAAAAPVRLNVAALQSRPDLSIEQKEIVERYESAWAKFAEFVQANSGLVQEMDASSGGRREALLNELRQRKYQEQPLRQELNEAGAVLLGAFPEVVSNRAAPAAALP